jgi:hypothetical protein
VGCGEVGQFSITFLSSKAVFRIPPLRTGEEFFMGRCLPGWDAGGSLKNQYLQKTSTDQANEPALRRLKWKSDV